MSDKEVVSTVKNKRTVNKKVEEVTCWNCFTTEEDNDVEPMPLSKIREEQREKFKLYSFLASELSKPKAVSLKQKVSEHYFVGKKLDERIRQNVDVSQYLQNNSEFEAAITGEHLPRKLVSSTSQTSPKVSEKSILGIRRKVDKSTETDINITIVKLTRSDSSSSSSTTPDFRPRRKLLPKPSTSPAKLDDMEIDKSDKAVLSSSLIKNLEESSKSLSRDNVDFKSKSSDPATKIVEPILPKKINRQLPGSEHADNKFQTMLGLGKQISKYDTTNVAKNTSGVGETRTPKTPEQKRRELLTIGKKIVKPSMVDSRSKLDSIPSTSSELTTKKATSVEPLKEKALSLKQRLRERYSLDKTSPKKISSITDTKKSQDKISSHNELSKSIGSISLKQILNEHYSIDKEIDETIAKYADLTKSKSKPIDKKDDSIGSKLEITKGQSRFNKDAGTVARFTDDEKVNKDKLSKSLTTGSKTDISFDSYESGQDESLLYENIDKFNNTSYEQIKTSTPKNENKKVSSETYSRVFDSVDKEIDEMISKCAVLSISDKHEEENSDKVSVPNIVIPIKTLERSAGEPKTYLSRIPIKEPSPDSLKSSRSVLSRINTSKLRFEINEANKEDKNNAAVSSAEALTKDNPIKTASSLTKKYNSDLGKPKNESLIFAQKLLYPETKEGAVVHAEKTDNTSSNGSESGYAGSSATVQDIQEMEAANRELEENTASKKDSSKVDTSNNTLRRQTFKSSLPVLNRIVEKRILKTTTTSKSLNTDINKAGAKTQLQPNRWNTLSTPPKTLSLQDEMYMSDTLSSGNATLPRRSSSPLPHDTDRDRFPLNRSGLQARSESMASVYSGAGEGARGGVAVRGEVQFSLLYNYRLGALEVGVRRARDLAPVDTKRNRSDPYVKVYLLPDKSKTGKRKTKVKKNTLNPVFEETLSFVQPLASLSARTLWLSVWHADIFGRNDFLGEVTLPLADVVFDDPAPTWYKLHERTEQFDEQQGSRGDLIVGLKFETDGRGKGTLHVLVKEAKNLVATKPNGLADVFCKSYLLPERGRLAKQKTTVARRTLSPRWEHTFTYRGLAPAELAERALELSLWDRDRLTSNDFMGAVRLSLGTGTYMGASVNWMDSMGKEVALWQTMMQRPNFWVEGSLPLRPQLNN